MCSEVSVDGPDFFHTSKPWKPLWRIQWVICQRRTLSRGATRGHYLDTLHHVMDPDKITTSTQTLVFHCQEMEDHFQSWAGQICHFNFIFHLDVNHWKALLPSALNVSCETEEHANTACFWCAGTWCAFWFHMRSSLHAAAGLLSFPVQQRL